jgi:hypothetical protein
MKNRILSLGLVVAVALSCAMPAHGMDFLRSMGEKFTPNWVKQKYVEKQVGDAFKNANSGLADFITNSGPLGQIGLVALGGLATFFVIQAVLNKKSDTQAGQANNEPNIFRMLFGLFAKFYGEQDTRDIFNTELQKGVQQVEGEMPVHVNAAEKLWKTVKEVNNDLKKYNEEQERNKPSLEKQIKDLEQQVKADELAVKAKETKLQQDQAEQKATAKKEAKLLAKQTELLQKKQALLKKRAELEKKK